MVGIKGIVQSQQSYSSSQPMCPSIHLLLHSGSGQGSSNLALPHPATSSEAEEVAGLAWECLDRGDRGIPKPAERRNLSSMSQVCSGVFSQCDILKKQQLQGA